MRKFGQDVRRWRVFIFLAVLISVGTYMVFRSLLQSSNGSFYVATNGSDSSLGSSSEPWRTIQYAANNVSAGDTVIVLTGNYPERVRITNSGASGAPITFRSQGTVTMQGFTVLADYITLRGFDISDTPDDSTDGWGIYLEGTHCTIEDNYVHFATRGGINLWASPWYPTITSNCVVRDNRLYRNGMVGIAVYGRDNLVEGNEIWGTIQYHPNWSNPPGWVDADGMRFFGSGHTIRGNYIHDISLQDPENVDPHIDCFQTWTDDSHEEARNILFEQNHCENLNVGMYAFMLEHASNLTIRNNILRAFAGVNTGGGGNSNLTIVNNVFASDLSFSPDQNPVGIGVDNAPNTTIKNNVFYDFTSHIIYGSSQGLDAGHNSVYRSDGESPQGSPYPNDIWNVDPRFVAAAAGDYHLRPDSPLIDTGASIPNVSNDYSGAARPQGSGHDIGAFEQTN